MDRRTFITASTAASLALMVDAHFSCMGAQPPRPTRRTDPLIRSLRLLTSARLSDMERFYREVIGFTILTHDATSFTMLGGATPITFVAVEGAGARPFYHFAFNIPENKIEQAFAWQRAKTPIVGPGVDSVDSVVHFQHWNAHSIFFHDPAGNLVEYIARHELQNASPGDFSARDILYASEIGFIVENVESSGSELMDHLGLAAYRPMSPGFWPIGDEMGLLLMIAKGKQWANPPGMINVTDVFRTEVGINALLPGTWTMSGYPCIIQGQ